MESKNLFLDDMRNPCEVTWVDYFTDEWEVVRSYQEFVSWIRDNGMPEFISFDHDLGDFVEIGSEKREYNGMDCAKWLVDYCIDNNLSCPKYIVHSQNPNGKKNIEGLLSNFMNFQARELGKIKF